MILKSWYRHLIASNSSNSIEKLTHALGSLIIEITSKAKRLLNEAVGRFQPAKLSNHCSRSFPLGQKLKTVTPCSNALLVLLFSNLANNCSHQFSLGENSILRLSISTDKLNRSVWIRPSLFPPIVISKNSILRLIVSTDKLNRSDCHKCFWAI